MKHSLLLLTIFFSIIQASLAQDSAFVNLIVTDFDSLPEVGAGVHVFNNDKTFKLKGTTNDLGLLKTTLPQGQNLTIEITQFDTLFIFKQTIPEGEYGSYEIPFHIKIAYLTSVIRRFTLPVYFASAKHELDDADKKSINELLEKMQDNKNMKIEIGAHTDSDGNDDYNQALSQRRANSVRAYLIANGIKEGRIAAKGYGETKPVASNDTNEGKARNRRVEILVIEE